MHYDNFVNIDLRPDNLDIYIVRKSIRDLIKELLPQLKGKLIDVGCGRMPYKSLMTSTPSRVTQYIGIDFENSPIHKNYPDITWQNGKIPLKDCSVDCAIATEVFEHCPDPEIVMREIFRVLKPSGFLFLTVPFLWPLHEVPYDEHRYTPFSLKRHLAGSGFDDIDLKPLGGWDASLGQMLGLWVRRRPMRKIFRAILSTMAMPILYVLFNMDKRKNTQFIESSMITGLSGIARKPVSKTETIN